MRWPLYHRMKYCLSSMKTRAIPATIWRAAVLKQAKRPKKPWPANYMEEADATIVALEALGSGRAAHPQSGEEFHHYYWCRVTLAEQVFPRSEPTMRHIIAPTDFLDTLEWGRRDPKAPRLFELALDAEGRYGDGRSRFTL